MARSDVEWLQSVGDLVKGIISCWLRSMKEDLLLIPSRYGLPTPTHPNNIDTRSGANLPIVHIHRSLRQREPLPSISMPSFPAASAASNFKKATYWHTIAAE